MITYKFYIDKRTLNSANEGSLKLRLINNRKKSEIGLGIVASEKMLNDALSTSQAPSAKRLSAFIAMRKSEIDKVIISLLDSGNGDIDVKKLCELVKTAIKIEETADETFLGWFRRFANGKTNKSTNGVYVHTISRMTAFDPQLELRKFEDITFKWLDDFDKYLAKTSPSKNARNIHLRNIRAVFNYAIDNEVTATYPFRRFKIRPEATRKRSLPIEDLRKLFDCPVEPYAEIYRDLFKLIFMLIGINTVDLHQLQAVSSEGRIEYRRAKTHKLYSIKVEPEAMEIINKYRGEKGLLLIADRWSDHRNFRDQMNNALKKIGAARYGLGGKKSGGAFPEISTYWARHSWATIAASLDIPKETIAAALGHEMGNSTTSIYIDFDQRKVDEANRRVLDWVLYGK